MSKTINELSTEFNRAPRTVRRWVEQFNKRNGTDHPESYEATVDDPTLLQFLQGKASKNGRGRPKKPVPPANPEIKPSRKPEKSPDAFREAQGGPILSERGVYIFEAESLRLVALLVIAVVDGWSFSLIGVDVTDERGILARAIYWACGVVVAYAGFKNAYDLQNKVVKYSDQKPNVGLWIFVFFVYQAVLHGAAAEIFDNWNIWVERVIFMTGAALSGAGIAVTLFKR